MNKNKMKILLLFSIVYLSLVHGLDNNDINMIVSFATEPSLRTRLVMSVLAPHTCWSSYKLKCLAKSLMDVDINMAVSLQPNRTEFYLHNTIVLADLSCKGTDDFLVKANEEFLFKSPYRWLLFSEGPQDQSVLNQLTMQIESDVVLAQKRGPDYEFIEVYRIKSKTELIYFTRALWRSKNNITDLETIQKNDTAVDFEDKTKNVTVVDTKHGIIEDYRSTVLALRRINIMKENLTISNIILDSNESKIHMSDRLQLSFDPITKMSYVILNVVCEMMNSTQHMIYDDNWGYIDNNGTWRGMIAAMARGEADLGTMALMTPSRYTQIDYISMIGKTEVHFVFRKPPLGYVANIYALPFTGAVWVASFVCVLACALFLYVASKWEATTGTHPLQLDGSWADVLILIIGAVLQQGCTQEPRRVAGRLVTWLLYIAVTVLYCAYAANIVVLLQTPSSSINTLQDLLDSPMELAGCDQIYNRYLIDHFKDPLRQAIYRRMVPLGKKPHLYPMKEGVEKVRKGLFAFHVELSPAYRMIQETFQEEEKCDLVEIDYIKEKVPWMPAVKRSPYKELFKLITFKIRQSGVQQCLYKRVMAGKPTCAGAVSSFTSVGITDMASAILVTLYGMLLAPAVLLVEIAHKRLTDIRENKRMGQSQR